VWHENKNKTKTSKGRFSSFGGHGTTVAAQSGRGCAGDPPALCTLLTHEKQRQNLQT
jgi:hypothetical protein